MKQTLAAIRAAIRDPRRTLAALRACEGVELDMIEVHDHDYNLQHVHDQASAAAAVTENYARRLQDEKVRHVATGHRLGARLQSTHDALQGLVAWVDGIGVERFPSFAGMNVQPLLNARAVLQDEAPARADWPKRRAVPDLETLKREPWQDEGIPLACAHGGMPAVQVVGVDTGEH